MLKIYDFLQIVGGVMNFMKFLPPKKGEDTDTNNF